MSSQSLNDESGAELIEPLTTASLAPIREGLEVLAYAARGGMGQIRRAYDRRLERVVAVKQVRGAASPQAAVLRTRLLHEARLAGRLQHPNIVSIFEVIQRDEELYVVMEWVSGETLARRLLNTGPLPLARALALLDPLLSATQYLHAERIVHRDIKPSNVMISHTAGGEEVVKLLDFGLAIQEPQPRDPDPRRTLPLDGDLLPMSSSFGASLSSSLSSDRSSGPGPGISGTPRYRAPEQARGELGDRRADLYALGVLLFELLAGAPPEEPDWRHPPLRWPPPLPGLDPALQALLAQAMAPDPADRFVDAYDMRRALLALLAQAPPPRVLAAAPAGEHGPHGLWHDQDGRYLLHEVIGEGGEGVVWRAWDRLRGAFVGLKRHRAVSSSWSAPSVGGSGQAIEAEFRTLSALHHPHIVRVLDLDRTASGEPFFTMRLYEPRQDIVQASRGQPLPVPLGYLQQTLRALEYLHRQGMLHRDLKPANVVVHDEQVKLIDFGLSVLSEEASPVLASSGTLSHTAPELFAGAPPSTRSDLYAAGLLAYEMLSGHHPHEDALHGDPEALRQRVCGTPPARLAALPPLLWAVVERLTATDPAERFASAGDALAALAQAWPGLAPDESAQIRASLLRSVPFVGRVGARTALEHALRDLLQPCGQGSTWWITGAPGMGRSRLAGALRVQAQLQGAAVVEGRAAAGDTPYALLAPLARWLALITGDTASGVSLQALQDIVPDLTRAPHPPPSLPPAEARARLGEALTQLLRGATLQRPLVLLLEDVHLASPEEQPLLHLLAQETAALPILLVATRTPAVGAAASSLPGPGQEIVLSPLPPPDIEALARAVLPTISSGVVAGLVEQSGGSPAQVLELVWAAADHLGGIEALAQAPALPTALTLPSALARLALVLERLDEHAPVLRLAALSRAAPSPDWLALASGRSEGAVRQALRHAARLGLIEYLPEGWTFCSPAARTLLLDDQSPAVQQQLHGQVLAALETTGAPPALLAEHAHHAGDLAREARWRWQAGQAALEQGADQRALVQLRRALSLTDGPSARQLLDIGEACLLGGAFAEGVRHLGAALVELGHPPPSPRVGWLLGALREALWRRPQSVAGLDAAQQQVYGRLARAISTLLNVAYAHEADVNQLLFFAMQALNLPPVASGRRHLAAVATGLGFVFREQGMFGLARHYMRRAQALLGDSQHPDALGRRCLILGYQALHSGQLDEALRLAAEGGALLSRAHMPRGAEESQMLASFTHFYRGDLPQALALQAAVQVAAERRADPLHIFFARVGAENYLRLLGRLPRSVLPLAPCAGPPFADRCLEAISAAALLHHGEARDARRLARGVLDGLLHEQARLAFLLETQSIACDVLLVLLDTRPDLFSAPSREDHLHLIATFVQRRLAVQRGMPLFTAAALRQRGMIRRLRGQTRRARADLRRALDRATALGLPLLAAECRVALAAVVPREEAAALRQEAAAAYAAMGVQAPLLSAAAATPRGSA